MKTALAILTMSLIVAACSEAAKEIEASSRQELIQSDTIESFNLSGQKTLADSTKNPTQKAEIESQLTNLDKLDPSPTRDVSVTLREIEFLDLDFYHKIDSLIKHEKRLLENSSEKLHWIFTPLHKDTYEFTVVSKFGGSYTGYAYIDNSLVLFAPKLQNIYRATNKKKALKLREFNPNSKLLSPFEDYSVWIFQEREKEMRIIKSYTLHAD